VPKLYTRNQGGNLRYYADLRGIGGGQVALKPPGSSRATTDEIEAHKLLASKIEEIQGKVAASGSARLKPFVDAFISQNPDEVTEAWLHDTELRLLKAVEYFGADRDLVSIEPKHIRYWLNKKLSHLANGTQRHYLHALSGLYRYAQELGVVPVGYNPVGGLYRKPTIVNKRQRTDEFFEINDAASFLDVARRLDQHHELIATYLLTGGRRTEVLGLLVSDVDFDNNLVRIQPNQQRRLKRVWSERSVPLWPQLEEILRPYVKGLDRSGDALLFPSQTDEMITDLRKPLGIIAPEAGMERPRLTKFRHTYATARLQTTDGGKQISLWTVAKELGHKNVSRVEDTYGHPSHYRPRGEAVEYRVDQE
jgi:integrase